MNELVVDNEPSLAVTLTNSVPASPRFGVKVKVLVAELNVMMLACVPLGLKVIVTAWFSGSVAPIVYVSVKPSTTLLVTSAGLNVGA